MKIVKVKDIEDCFDGSFIKEFLYDKKVTKDFIHYLGKTGKLDYFPDFARPFYKLSCPKKYTLKGVEGSNSSRITLYGENLEEVMEYLDKYIEEFKCSGI